MGSVRSSSGLTKYWMKMYNKITIMPSRVTTAEATEEKKNLHERNGILLRDKRVERQDRLTPSQAHEINTQVWCE